MVKCVKVREVSRCISAVVEIIQGLNTELCTDIEEQSNFDTENIPEMDQCIQNEASTSNNQNIPDLNKGIKLPKSTMVNG